MEDMVRWSRVENKFSEGGADLERCEIRSMPLSTPPRFTLPSFPPRHMTFSRTRKRSFNSTPCEG